MIQQNDGRTYASDQIDQSSLDLFWGTEKSVSLESGSL